MKFIDLGRQYGRIGSKIEERMNGVLRSQQFIMGPEIAELEEKLAGFVGRKYCLSCSSGTDALVIPLMAYGLHKEDVIFVPDFTFFASAESVNLAGGTPVFVDVNQYFNIDPDDLERQIERIENEDKLNARGIVAVDLFGQSADYDRILEIAKKHGLFVLEDAAQGFGGSLHGKRNGSFGDVSATSFFPAKPLGCYGDGGAIFTDDEKLYDAMISIRVHGCGTGRYDNVRIGMNGRMDTLQAAILLEKLAIFEDEMEKRQKVAGWYRERLDNVLKVPEVPDGYYSVWAQYSVLAKDSIQRKKIIAELREKDIPVMVYYPTPLHKQTVYVDMGYGEESHPYSEDFSKRVFSVPMHPYLTEDEVSIISDVINKAANI